MRKKLIYIYIFCLPKKANKHYIFQRFQIAEHKDLLLSLCPRSSFMSSSAPRRVSSLIEVLGVKEVQLEVIGQRVGRSGDTPNIINGVVDGGEAPENESNEKGKENNFICEY